MIAELVILVTLATLLAAAVLVLRAQALARLAGGMRSYRLGFPRGLEAKHVQDFISGLSGLLLPWWRRPFAQPAIVFEVVAATNGVTHWLHVPDSVADFVTGQLRGAVPDVRVVEEAPPRLTPTEATELRLTSSTIPLGAERPEGVAAAILATCHPLTTGEQLVVQWVVAPHGPMPLTPRRPGSTGIVTWLNALWAPPAKPTAEDREALSEAKDKQAQPLLVAVCRLGAQAADRGRGRQLLRRIDGAFHVVRRPGVHFDRRLLPSRLARHRLTRRSLPLIEYPCTLNAAELTALVGWPLGSPQLPGLTLGGARQLAPDPSLPTGWRVLARSTFPGAERPVALSVTDSLKHVHVLGPTGVGKSTLLLNLIAADMAAGYGVCVIDPKGDLASDVLERVPREREIDVVLLDPTDAERPVGLNVLQVGDQVPELVADQVVGIFHHLFAAFWGPRTDDILRSALLTLLSTPGMTLCEVPLLLTDEAFRRRLVGRLDDPVGLEPFWAWYENLSLAERSQAIGPVMNKLRTFLLRSRVRNVIGQADPAIDLNTIVREGKILIVALPKGLLGEEAGALVGSLVVARLWQAVQGRAALPREQRRPFFAHIDEFQDYLNLPTSLSDLLAQARAYGLGLTLAHQHLGQLPAPVRQAVLANARTKVIFQLAAADARVVAREFEAYLEPSDLQGLGAHEVMLALAQADRVAPPVTAVTMTPPPETGRGTAVRAAARMRYGRDRAEVDAAIRARHEGRAGRPTAVRRSGRRP